jgi:RNA polymerase sigma factor (sigma-70 family)
VTKDKSEKNDTGEAGDASDNQELARLLLKFAAKGGKGDTHGAVRAAQDAFYKMLNKALETHAMRIVNYNEEIARNALQEAWIKIFLGAEKYNPSLAKVKTWAKRIVFQCAMDELRSHYRHYKHTDPNHDQHDDAGMDSEADFENIACPLPNTEDKLYASQIRQAVEHCIAQLPADKGPNYRLAMKLNLDQDLTLADMKDILAAQSPRHEKINAEQVRGWVRKASELMKACLNLKLGWNQGGRPA